MTTRQRELPQEQRELISRCRHPNGRFRSFDPAWVSRSLPEHFVAQLSQYADRLAIESDDGLLSYEELNRRANGVARALLAHLGPEDESVGILMPKRLPLFAAILGTLKAGKAYVPLDPALPNPRLRFIAADAGVRILLTDDAHAELARELLPEDCELLKLDDVEPDDDEPGVVVSPGAPAWVLYTSGSTGKPKGVVQTHENVLHYVMNYTNYFHVCPEDRVTLLMPFSVNGAAHDTFLALMNGASLFPYELSLDRIVTLADWLESTRVTIYCSVPTVFRRFAAELTGEKLFPDLRLIRLIGEPVYKKDVLAFQRHFSDDALLVNRLGSTETGSVLFYFIDKSTVVDGNNVPVGFEVTGNEVLLLDDAGRPLDGSDVGEISVRSRYLSTGYWRRPDLTEKAFHGDAKLEGHRIYRMGDMGRFLPDGKLLCLGRKDSQVKIRGHRIELSEIQLALEELDEVEDAFVMAHDKGDGERKLTAYVVPRRGLSPTITALRETLAAKLPSHMVPSHFLMLGRLPQAPNGKVDRRALPMPGRERPALDVPFAPPEGKVEQTLARIWSELLELAEVGVDDPFLQLGGDSLLATRIASRVQDAFRLDIPLAVFLRRDTVRQQAEVVLQAFLEAEESSTDRSESAPPP